MQIRFNAVIKQDIADERFGLSQHCHHPCDRIHFVAQEGSRLDGKQSMAEGSFYSVSMDEIKSEGDRDK